jgi:hypothetical protein
MSQGTWGNEQMPFSVVTLSQNPSAIGSSSSPLSSFLSILSSAREVKGKGEKKS